jgi:hypothetical protein
MQKADKKSFKKDDKIEKKFKEEKIIKVEKIEKPTIIK